MHKLYELRDMLMDELEECTDKGELSAGSLEIVDKLTHSIKSIDTILAMEEAGYSNEGYSNEYSNRGYSNARGRGRNARRDSMGRYSRESYNGGMSGRSSRRGYSRDKDELMEQLRDLEMSTQDENTKQMIRKFIMQAEEN